MSDWNGRGIPDEQMLNGNLHVEITAISYVNRGLVNGRKRKLKDRWTLYFTLHFEDSELEQTAITYWEGQHLITNAGYDREWWTQGKQILEMPIPVVLDSERKLIEVLAKEPIA